MRYALPFDDVETDAIADNLRTLALLTCADTAGSRVQLTGFTIGPAGDAPSDATLLIELKRIGSVTAGSAGTAASSFTASAMPKSDSEAPDSPATGGVDYSAAEPTAYEASPLFVVGVNTRSWFSHAWGVGEGPVVGRDQAIGLLVAPRAAAAQRVSGVLEFEAF